MNRTVATALEKMLSALERNAVTGVDSEAYAAGLFLRDELRAQYGQRADSLHTVAAFLETLPESPERDVTLRSVERTMMIDTFTRYTDPEKGCLWVEVTQMDADCVEFTRLHDIEPTPEAWEALRDAILEQAECGPAHLSMRVMDPARVEIWEPRDRDRILEARENGENYRV